MILEVLRLDSSKRPEEAYKFVFMRCLKHMKFVFKNKSSRKYKKDKLEKAFYNHFFEEII